MLDGSDFRTSEPEAARGVARGGRGRGCRDELRRRLLRQFLPDLAKAYPQPSSSDRISAARVAQPLQFERALLKALAIFVEPCRFGHMSGLVLSQPGGCGGAGGPGLLQLLAGLVERLRQQGQLPGHRRTGRSGGALLLPEFAAALPKAVLYPIE